jgi:hypothetical protein
MTNPSPKAVDTYAIVATYAPCCGIIHPGDREPGVMHCALPHEQKTVKLVDEQDYRDCVKLLCDLLAVIHRDGGHHTHEVGLAQSAKDAANILQRLQYLVSEVSYSGVELEDNRISYVVVQVDKDIWKEIKERK